MDIPVGKLESFTDAFDENTGSCRRTCACGREFFDGYNNYDWCEGEIEKLREDPNATELGHSVGAIDLEGRSYMLDCECWHERAKRIINWLDANAEQVAAYLTLEKKRKLDEANNSPVVE